MQSVSSPKEGRGIRLLVISHDSSMYGACQSLVTLLVNLRRLNYEIMVLVPQEGALQRILANHNIKYQTIRFPISIGKRTAFTYLSYFKNWFYYDRKESAAVNSVLPIVKEFNPDILYSNTSVVSIGFKLSKILGRRHVWHVREFGYNYIYFPPRSVVRRRMNKSSWCIFGSMALQKAWGCMAEKNSSVIYNGISDPTDIFPIKNISPERINVGIIGSIQPEKGQEVAIKALTMVIKRFPNCQLHFFGTVADQAYHRRLQKLLVDHGLEGVVHFRGFVPDQDVIFNDLSLVVSCSYMEGFGRTIVEAMVRGVPVIANATGGIVEIIHDNVSGKLYDGTDAGLSEAMLYLLDTPTLYRKVSENGMIRSKDFSIRDYVTNVSNVFARVRGVEVSTGNHNVLRNVN